MLKFFQEITLLILLFHNFKLLTSIIIQGFFNTLLKFSKKKA